MQKPKRRYKRYSSEFKREALLRASEEGTEFLREAAAYFAKRSQ